MLRKPGLYSVLAAVALAAPLHAEEHYVLLLDTAYFPDVLHPAPGDFVRFYNQGVYPMEATASDQSWTTGVLEPGQDYLLEVVDGMGQTYTSAPPEPDDGTVAATGEIDYVNPAPVDLGADGKPLTLADEAYAN